ncbi:hypothetical protein A9R05_22975 [Burkholderia sp. KK1]|nr:hypothetical protein A9R05_22975 [Burkholderia sp. KK1]
MECEADAIKARWLETVAERGGTLLGTFTGLLERYRLRCVNGHEWETQGRKISEGHWCHLCQREGTARRILKTDGLPELQRAAAAKGGRCLAETYTGGRTYYPFECAMGHRWEAQGSEIVRGSWCRQCLITDEFGPRAIKTDFYDDGLERLQEAARQQGGKSLATEYTGSHDRYRFRCAAGHEWTQLAAQIWLGHWCGRCVKIAQCTPIEASRALAESRGGKCLSPQTEEAGVKLTWECHRGHVWQTTPAILLPCTTIPESRRSDRQLREWLDRVANA